LTYDPDTGLFTRIKGHKIGTQITGNTQGYLSIRVGYNSYRAHRLAWLYVYGVFPKGILDHKNRDRLDNRISNLREASRALNMHNAGLNKNNTSGHKGIHQLPSGKYRVRIMHKRKPVPLGSYDTLDEAIEVRKDAEFKYFDPRIPT